MTRRLAPLLALFLLAGCMDSLDRRETMSPFAGDSQAQSIAAQAVNPWPSAAYEKTWTTEGWILLRRPTVAAAPAAPAPTTPATPIAQ